MTYVLLILAQLGLIGNGRMPVVMPAAGADAPEAAICAAAPAAFAEGPDPFHIPLTTSRHAIGAEGEARLSFAASPFGIAVDQDGRHVYRIELRTSGLEIPGRASPADSADPAAGSSAARSGTRAVAWVATPDLDLVVRLGTLREDGTLTGRVAFNKFLLFVTAETDADTPSADTAETRPAPAADGAAERWSGPVLLSGISRSGLLHTMAGHGPFEGEPC